MRHVSQKLKIVTIPLAELVMAFYPRHAVDSQHVANLVQAIHAGCQLPPVVADRASKRITDGRNRRLAAVRVDLKRRCTMSPKSKIVTMPLAELVEDMAFYPRHAVDSQHVANLVQAIHAGCQLPPVVADRESKRITDGWHRTRAYCHALGPDASIEVEIVPYPDEASMKLDAAAHNASHGRRLDAIDRMRCVVMLRIGIQRYADRLGPERARGEGVEVGCSAGTHQPAANGNITGTSTIALKRCVGHLADTRLTREQAEVHQSLPGTSFLLVARQLRRALETAMVDLSDEKLVEELKALNSPLRKRCSEVLVNSGTARHGMARLGMAGEAGPGGAGRGLARRGDGEAGVAGKAWPGVARPG